MAEIVNHKSHFDEKRQDIYSTKQSMQWLFGSSSSIKVYQVYVKKVR